jgi:FMN phosphatase YigB (HAD superfamily)
VTYRAVLFDWMLTLADYPPPAAMLRRAYAALGRPTDETEIGVWVTALRTADEMPEVESAMATVDCSVAEHRAGEMLRFGRAGFDDELAETLYSLIGDPAVHRVYAEVPGVLERLSSTGVRIVVVSDIHVDLRAHASAAGIDGWIDDWVLSFEHGVQKPDPQFYELALARAGVVAGEALMVGDRHVADGAASLLGMDSLILPARDRVPDVHDSRLEGVVRLVG